MAHVLFVCPAGLIPPENLVLLQHELVVAANGTEALNNLEITDAVVVDAREELAAARSSCQVLAAAGVEEPDEADTGERGAVAEVGRVFTAAPGHRRRLKDVRRPQLGWYGRRRPGLRRRTGHRAGRRR